MSERKLEVIDNVEKQYRDETCNIQYDIIDLSNFDFSDNDRWLYEPVECSSETTVHDLHAWLRNSSEISSQNTPPATKRFTDTRTFTRPKKRNTRTSFESIMEALPPYLQQACKIRDKEFHNFYQSANKTNDKKEGIPFMLKGTMGGNRYNPDDVLITSGQESMEAFINMSQSKGIDSFINLGEPDFGDTLMNVSHPSVLYSSIISMNNDNTYNTDYDSNTTLETLSYPTMDKCQFIKVRTPKVNLETTFVSKFNDKTIVKNKDKSRMSINNTFINEPTNIEKMNLKDTCNIDIDNDTSSTLVNSKIENALSSTYTNLSDLNVTVIKSDSNEARNSLDTTYQCVDVKEEKNVAPVMNVTNTFDTYKQNIHVGSNVEETTTQCSDSIILPVQSNCIDSIPQLPVSYSNHSSKQENLLNSTFTSMNKNMNQYQSTCMNPPEEIPSLRRELLTEIQRSGKYKLHSVYNNIPDESCTQSKTNENINVTYDSNIIQKSNIPIENKYNTYRKQPSKEQFNSKNELSDCNVVTTCTQKDTQNRKFYTFTKKTANINGKSNIETAAVEQQQQQQQSLPPSNIDETFCKPISKAPKKKLHAPKKLSKLPQFLQNSNPNLLSNPIKTINATTRYSYIPNVRRTCINTMESITKPMTTKSYSLGKLRSGSEQRLPHVDINTTFQKPNSGGSTESIDSTQSAHSAPDLDDRLSMCSDSSHNSYNVCTTNMEQLSQIVYMQEGTKNLATCTPKKQILRNNWIDDTKDLPSPILKNHVEETENNSISPLSIDSTVKTSSPILSPTGSSQAINNNEVHKISSHLEEKEQENAVGLVKQTTNRLPNTTEIKTKLRPPSNWNTGNKIAGVTSGIPRPQSRIPAPRFVRPNVKTTTATQGDLKKGYL
ncbi:PREDICTED: uncharacterized protein LOC107070948 isoform X2 [Polistes dominula]|uniref:Uncharacterized protein LOC107070948 isoform X2 n=1 Tax=Polistes dominula TaxID=743375 RepID=A0ABM1IXR9_POLDO|nr:PREDICTED: uncharacterized protein LOC107070948 isoform X2 [Polistes dominula]